jgi:alpha-methylacyl-CoA racemase
LNLIGDFGGGALYLAMGVLAATIEAGRSGRGQVVDAAIVDGTANLMTMFHSFLQMGAWATERGVNIIDGGAPFYDVYETSDGKFVSVAAVEGKFYDELVERMGLARDLLPRQHDRKRWPELRARFAETFKSRTRDEWCELLEGSDACFAPVLDMVECQAHPHIAARNIHQSIDGVINPAPAPRFSRTPGGIAHPATAAGADTFAVLERWGIDRQETERIKASGAAR